MTNKKVNRRWNCARTHFFHSLSLSLSLSLSKMVKFTHIKEPSLFSFIQTKLGREKFDQNKTKEREKLETEFVSREKKYNGKRKEKVKQFLNKWWEREREREKMKSQKRRNVIKKKQNIKKCLATLVEVWRSWRGEEEKKRRGFLRRWMMRKKIKRRRGNGMESIGME